MSITIYHNPRCSKSRKTLELLESNGVRPTIVEYLRSPPDAATTLNNARLIGVRVADLLRRGEDEFKQANDESQNCIGKSLSKNIERRSLNS